MGIAPSSVPHCRREYQLEIHLKSHLHRFTATTMVIIILSFLTLTPLCFFVLFYSSFHIKLEKMEKEISVSRAINQKYKNVKKVSSSNMRFNLFKLLDKATSSFGSIIIIHRAVAAAVVKLRKLHFIQIQSGHYFIIIFVITFRC
jgi:hypothetical protein